jgi:hypothetical protein
MYSLLRVNSSNLNWKETYGHIQVRDYELVSSNKPKLDISFPFAKEK